MPQVETDLTEGRPGVEHRSLWADTLPTDERTTGAPLSGDTEVDVAIVGAGLTGLWTAWHLLRRDPTIRVAVLERDTIGFGASGRNGGWCSSLLPMSLPAIAAAHGGAAARRMQEAMHDNVADVVDFAHRRGIADACHRGGTITLARTRPQVERLREHLDTMSLFGFGADYVWLDAAEAGAVCNATGVLGGVRHPHCASVHPLRLTHAVARAAGELGARIHEHTSVVSIDGRRLRTEAGLVRADVVIRATEAYTGQFRGQRRALLPIYSLMVATAPIDDATWGEIGLSGRPTFHDARHLIVYGQRTADGRIAFGGRGAPYHFGSRVRPEFDTDVNVRELLTEGLREMFPVLRDVEVTHHWGGALAAPRDWTCSVRFDRSTGLGTAGGYVGDGVATTHLAGRTLAALVTGAGDAADRDLLSLPWVGHRSRRWEPEPLRWLGVNGARLAAARADAVEQRSGRRSRLWGAVIDAVLGH